MRAETVFRISVRIPPTLDPIKAGAVIKEILEKDPPYGANVVCNVLAMMPGWNAPEMQPELAKSLFSASMNFFQ